MDVPDIVKKLMCNEMDVPDIVNKLMHCELDTPDIVKKGMRYEMVLKAEFWWWRCGGWLAWPSSSSSGIKLWKIIVQWKLRKKCKASKYAGRYTLPTRKFQQELIMNLHGSVRENCHVSIEQMINSDIFAFPSFSFGAYILQKLKSNWMEFSSDLFTLYYA